MHTVSKLFVSHLPIQYQQNAITVACSEMLINAIEHGILGISFQEKETFVSHATWLNTINQRLKQRHKTTKPVIDMLAIETTTNCEITVQDSGAGYDWAKKHRTKKQGATTYSPSGQGMRLIDAAFDAVFFDAKGSCISGQLEKVA